MKVTIMKTNDLTTKPFRGIATVLQDGKPVARFAGSFSFAEATPTPTPTPEPTPAPGPRVMLSVHGTPRDLAALHGPWTIYNHAKSKK